MQGSQLKFKIQSIKNLYHLIQAVIANIWYGFPSRKIKVIGITGTDGKTTTTHLIYHILKNSGKRVSMISTVYAKVGDHEFETGLHTTTPNPFLIQKLLRQAVDENNEFFVLETTSHALDQNRVWGISFRLAVVTNISHEHLDYHQTYENYVKAKSKLLLNAKDCLINVDDQSFILLKKILEHDKKTFFTYSLREQADNRNILSQFKLMVFNQHNYLAAINIAVLVGLDRENVIKTLADFKLPVGRMERMNKNGINVVIDFAHTPNAFEEVLKDLKTSLNITGKIIHIFGAAGLRDKQKRPLMGEISSRYSDIIILTEEDYRTEDVQEICKQISFGIKKNSYIEVAASNLKNDQTNVYTIIPDRQDAVNKAVKLAMSGDLIIMTGKGHEQSLCRGKVEYPWDEKKAVIQAFQN